MSKKKASPAGGGSQTPPPTGPSRRAQPPPTPHRPVVSLALVLFVPALLLVLHGNLSVQAALLRFIGALLVSWVAAWIVFATVSFYAGSARMAQAATTAASAAEAGRAERSAGSTGTNGVVRAGVAGGPGISG